MLRLTVLSQNPEEVVLKVEGWISEENVGVSGHQRWSFLRSSYRESLFRVQGVAFLSDSIPMVF